MFEALAERLQGVFHKLAKRGKLRPADVDSALREIRLALLEADVHYGVVKEILAAVRSRALSEEVSRALNPTQHVIGILYDELVAILGEPGKLSLHGKKPRSIMLVGLQGSGKTTTAAKLAKLLKGRGERVWFIAADPYRPAAVEQLELLGNEIDVPMFYEPGLSPADLSKSGIDAAAKGGASVVILDTAGRSQLDQLMMDELSAIRDRIDPVEILLVADAMTGQEAVNIAKGFQEPLGLSGMILTKMDGDARGGAAISMRAVTGVPIKFLGVGEEQEALEIYQPSRLASRIIGRGDMLGLLQKAETGIEVDRAGKQIDRIRQGEFDFEDFTEQLAMMQRMGPLSKIVDMLPGGLLSGSQQIDAQFAENQLLRTQAIIQSMTSFERRNPDVLNASRKRRIASGSGTSVQEVNQLLRQFRQVRRVFKKVGKRGVKGLTPWL
ncbi:MAG: signal recognition particle protein [Anaerolineales bacterium]|nr:signal recognition particle protein [Anaerolineales bacterium]